VTRRADALDALLDARLRIHEVATLYGLEFGTHGGDVLRATARTRLHRKTREDSPLPT
jgi:hypothetical protein